MCCLQNKTNIFLKDLELFSKGKCTRIKNYCLTLNKSTKINAVKVQIYCTN